MFYINLIFIITYISSTLVSIFMYCYVAENIRNEVRIRYKYFHSYIFYRLHNFNFQSAGLFHAIYEMQWYELLPKDCRLLLIVMKRFMSPIEITVGKFSVFSLEYFTSV